MRMPSFFGYMLYSGGDPAAAVRRSSRWCSSADAGMGGAGELTVSVRRVAELLRGPAVTCAPATTVADVASRMAAGVAGVVVVDADGAPVGIVTDRDLRTKVVALRRDAGATRPPR